VAEFHGDIIIAFCTGTFSTSPQCRAQIQTLRKKRELHVIVLDVLKPDSKVPKWLQKDTELLATKNWEDGEDALRTIRQQLIHLISIHHGHRLSLPGHTMSS
jgi:hypothetical protein